MTYQDFADQPIAVGDYIVYAAAQGQSNILRYGRVTRLVERPASPYGLEHTRSPVPTLRVVTVDRGYKKEWTLQNGGNEITLSFLSRLLVIPAAKVPAEVRHILASPKATSPGVSKAIRSTKRQLKGS